MEEVEDKVMIQDHKNLKEEEMTLEDMIEEMIIDIVEINLMIDVEIIEVIEATEEIEVIEEETIIDMVVVIEEEMEMVMIDQEIEIMIERGQEIETKKLNNIHSLNTSINLQMVFLPIQNILKISTTNYLSTFYNFFNKC